MSFPRPLNETEKAVLMRVFEMTSAPELDALTWQVEAGIATRPCECPCPSITLAVDHARAHPISHEGRLDLEVYYDTGVMVWVDDGWLSNLETWSWSDDPPQEFPPLDALRLTPPD